MKFYIPHKIKVGDITKVADNDSRIAISEGIKVEDIVDIEDLQSVFKAVVTDISPNSVEVEILEKTEDRTNVSKDLKMVLMQSISNEKKFTYFLEKAVELGVTEIFPIASEHSQISVSDFKKKDGLWKKVIEDAVEQSRNIYPPIIKPVIELKHIQKDEISSSLNICLATENIELSGLHEVLKSWKGNSITIAIGPESGWGSKDIPILKFLGFKFVKLKGNILRTETAGLVITSIIKFIKGKM